MSLEEGIVEWSATRPPWQRAVLKRVAAGDFLSDKDYDELIDALLASNATPEVTFGLEQLPKADIGDPPVTLASIAEPKHVNALVERL